MDHTVTLAVYPDIQEASIVKGMLGANGIPSMISDNNNLYVPYFGGVNLLVRESDFARAKELLRKYDDSFD